MVALPARKLLSDSSARRTRSAQREIERITRGNRSTAMGAVMTIAGAVETVASTEIATGVIAVDAIFLGVAAGEIRSKQ